MTRALIADIIVHAANLSGLTVAQVKGNSRVMHIVRVRHAACLVAYEQTRRDGKLVLRAYSYPQIGAVFGKDHSTIIHGVKLGKELCLRDMVFSAFVQALREAARTGRMFAKLDPKPITVPALKRPHIKAVTLAHGEEPDEGHKFHTAIGKGSAALLKALAA